MSAWTDRSASSASAPLAISYWTKRLVVVNKDTLDRQIFKKFKEKVCVCVCVLLWAAFSSLAVCLCLVCPACHSHRETSTVTLLSLSHTLCPSHPSPSF